MFKHLFFSCLLLAVVLPSAVWSAPKGEKVGTIREAHAAFKNNGNCAENAEWKDEAKSNTKFRQLDCFKTDNGGAVRLELNDNSSFSIAENSLVIIDNLVEKDESGAFRIKLDIQKGYMGFKAEKKKGHEVNFSTGTAAASIRGTEGFIGEYEGTFFASLKNGELSVKFNGDDPVTITGGQTVIANKEFPNHTIVLNLKSSGDLGFAKVLVGILADTTLSVDSLTSKIIQADNDYQEKLNQSNESIPAKDSVAQQPVADTQPVAVTQPVADTIGQQGAIPQIKFSSYDSLRCAANISISGLQKDSKTRVKTYKDGSEVADMEVKRNIVWRSALSSGIHEYEYVVENEAGRSSFKKVLGCYPMKPFSVKVFGKQYVRLQIPPPPPGVADVITQTLQFEIRVPPENDPIVLNKVVVKQNGKVILQERLSQITNLKYEIPVVLKRAFKNRFDIEVIHKSGYSVKTYKIYEVGK